jgi:hypothetical protein
MISVVWANDDSSLPDVSQAGDKRLRVPIDTKELVNVLRVLWHVTTPGLEIDLK